VQKAIRDQEAIPVPEAIRMALIFSSCHINSSNQ
jgi:hypothetical protein